MTDPQGRIVTWAEIHRRFWHPRSKRDLMKYSEELQELGVVRVEWIGNARKAWTLESMFIPWLLIHNRKMTQERKKRKNKEKQDHIEAIEDERSIL